MHGLRAAPAEEGRGPFIPAYVGAAWSPLSQKPQAPGGAVSPVRWDALPETLSQDRFPVGEPAHFLSDNYGSRTPFSFFPSFPSSPRPAPPVSCPLPVGRVPCGLSVVTLVTLNSPLVVLGQTEISPGLGGLAPVLGRAGQWSLQASWGQVVPRGRGPRLSPCPSFLPLPQRGRFCCHRGAPDGESACRCRRREVSVFSLWVGKTPCRRNWQPLHSYLRIPWTEGPGGLLSMGRQRVGHN